MIWLDVHFSYDESYLYKLNVAPIEKKMEKMLLYLYIIKISDLSPPAYIYQKIVSNENGKRCLIFDPVLNTTCQCLIYIRHIHFHPLSLYIYTCMYALSNLVQNFIVMPYIVSCFLSTALNFKWLLFLFKRKLYSTKAK